MKIAIVGPGAIGGQIAVRLATGGADVSVLARGANLAAIAANGITLQHTERGSMTARPRASADPAILGPQDAVLVTVKTTGLAAAAPLLAPLIGPRTPVAFVVNGIPWWYGQGMAAPIGAALTMLDSGGVLARAVPPAQVTGGVVAAAASLLAPGVIAQEAKTTRLVLGHPDAAPDPALDALAAHLTAGGMGAAVTRTIRDAVWDKLISNMTGGPLAILGGASLKDVYADPVREAAIAAMMDEAGAIARAAGADPGFDHAARRARGRAIDHKPSILQDLEQGRAMEIATMFDAPLALARACGVATPMLDLMAALVRLRARNAGCYSG
ncbi:MAG: 2-dehydropantoate 2-reductase [Rhodospirillales bacterium]|nr:2-dehydropantoate 2-reductase [Rhodospirillales bacterium]